MNYEHVRQKEPNMFERTLILEHEKIYFNLNSVFYKRVFVLIIVCNNKTL